MLTIYRRHGPRCSHKGRRWRRCRCPIWVEGTLAGEPIRKSMSMRDWEMAQSKVRVWEEEQKASALCSVTLERAKELFLLDAQARKLSHETIRKYKVVLKALSAFAQSRSLRQLDLVALKEWRATWKLSPLTSLKRLDYVRTFFNFCFENGWVRENVAAKLQPPKVKPTPTLPFSRQEMVRILAACEVCSKGYKGPHYTRTQNRLRIRAFVLTLRYTGMRIGDVVGLEKSRVQNQKLFLYTQKTGTPVYLPLPDFVLQALDQVPDISPRYYFWRGDSRLAGAVAAWQRTLQHVFETAAVQNDHAHRFRDTFAVELLLSGVPLERVSVLLGHSSVKITERHYAPWVRERQEQMEADVRRAWERDPILNRTISVEPKDVLPI